MGGRCAAAADAPHTARSVSSHLKVVDARRNPVHACHGLAKSRPLARAEETICRSRVPLREESLRKGIDEWELPGSPVGQVRRGFNRITDSRFGGQFDSEERFVWETENLQPDLVHVRHRRDRNGDTYRWGIGKPVIHPPKKAVFTRLVITKLRSESALFSRPTLFKQ